MINFRKTLNEAHDILEAQGIAHALIGGFTLAVYGQHRAKIDIDFLADGNRKEAIKAAFLAKGYSLKIQA